MNLFQNLEEFIIFDPMDRLTDEEVPNVEVTRQFEQAARGLKSFGMHCLYRAFPLALNVGSCVTELSTRLILDTELVSSLRNCSALRSIDLVLERGAEQGFPESIKSLRSLRLEWEQGNEIHFPSSQILSRLVRRNPELEELHLKWVAISDNELKTILEATGRKLISLGLTLSKGAFFNFVQVLHLAACYNSCLETLVFLDFDHITEIMDYVEGVPTGHIELAQHFPPARLPCPSGTLAEMKALRASILSVLGRRLPKLCLQHISGLLLYHVCVHHSGSMDELDDVFEEWRRSHKKLGKCPRHPNVILY